MASVGGPGAPAGGYADRLAAARVARLATVRTDGHPHLVPVTFALVGDRYLVTAVDGKPKRSSDLQRLRNIAARPAVSLLVDHYADDWAQLWWLRVDGTAAVSEAAGPEAAGPSAPEAPAALEALDALRAKYPQYMAAPPAGPVITVTMTSWVGWSAE